MSSAGAVFELTQAHGYGHAQLERLTVEMMKTNMGAFLDEFQTAMDGLFEGMGEDIEGEFFGIGGGARGQRASISTNTVTLKNKWHVFNFHEGMTVRASANEDGSSPRTGRTTVSAVDYSAGTITLADASQLASFANDGWSELVPPSSTATVIPSPSVPTPSGVLSPLQIVSAPMKVGPR